MQGVIEDLRYAAGVLRRTPTLTAVAVLTLALGIAVTTTVFGWIDGMVLHPFRGATDDGRLAVLEAVRASGIEAPNVSYVDCRDFEENLRSISGLAMNQQAPGSVGDGENAYSAWFELVSGNYFDVLGVKPVLGRTFAREEYGDQAKGFTAVISYRLWRAISGATRPLLAAPCALTGTRSPSSVWRLRNFAAIYPGSRMDVWVPAPLARERSAMRGVSGRCSLKPGRQRLRSKCRSGRCRLAPCPRLSEDQRGVGARDRTDLESAVGSVRHFGDADGHTWCGLRTRAADCLR